jgi:hypothetical protein
VNFKKIAKEITEVHDNIWRLYQYIYDSNELDKLNEALEHGYTSIKKHLLIITNLIVHEFLQTREPTMYNKRDKLPLPDT